MRGLRQSMRHSHSTTVRASPKVLVGLPLLQKRDAKCASAPFIPSVMHAIYHT